MPPSMTLGNYSNVALLIVGKSMGSWTLLDGPCWRVAIATTWAAVATFSTAKRKHPKEHQPSFFVLVYF